MPEKYTFLHLDRHAETPPQRLALLIGVGAALVVSALWIFGDSDSTPVGSSSQISAMPPPPPPAITPAPVPIAPSAPAVSSTGFELHGVMGTGEDGAAIIAVQGVQRLVRVGREVAPGIAVQAIAADHVVLLDRGTTVRLGFPGAPISGDGPISITPAATPSSRLGLAPQRVAGRTGGYVIRPGGALPALAAAGLRNGDVIISVGGTILESEDDLERIPREMSGTGQVEVEYVRDGRVRRVAVDRR